MRLLVAATSIAACCLASLVTPTPAKPHAAAPARPLMSHAGAVKPGARPGAETCPYAHDNECDEPVYGTGLCPANSDYSDCRFIRYGENDSCQYAHDGECDEPHFGTGACVQGSDKTDCGDVARLRFETDSCATAFNGVCEETSAGRNGCAPRTDRSDCIGRDRPMAIGDHFFGHDDRVLMNTGEFPWSAVGEITFADQVRCTATLIKPDIILTAAHCITRDNAILSRGEFETGRAAPGGPFRANIIAHFINPRFDHRRYQNSGDVDGFDWALLRIDQPLGARVGFIPVAELVENTETPHDLTLLQAGYSWDTGDRLSGNTACKVDTLYPDGTFSHDCDTTHGDSGSPMLVRQGDSYKLVGIDSRFRSNPGGSFLYIAVGSRAYARYVEDFAARRIGIGSDAQAKK